MRKSGNLNGHFPTVLVVVVGIVASIIAYATVRETRVSQANAAFTSLATTHANIIVEGFSQTFIAIESVGALYGSSESVSWSQFADFAVHLLKRFPTIAALGWVPQVHHKEREGFEQAAQKLFPGFRITERNSQNLLVDSAERQTYFPVFFILPYAGNEAAHGFDLYSDKIRRKAIDQARDSGQTTSTARISLVQEQGNQYSVLLIHPIFHDEGSATDRGALLGVASAVYRIGDGVEKALSQVHSANLNIWLFDRSGEADTQFLYFHSSNKQQVEQRASEAVPAADAIQYVHEFNLGGREFELILSPASDYFNISGGIETWLALIIGLVFTALLAAYLELVLRRSRELMAGQKALQYQINERKNAEQHLREANRNLEILSREDPLMGIANRRYFDEYFRQEWKRAVRHGTSLSLLIGDVDYFKSYNDTYGHSAGDECLRKIAWVLTDALDRPGDLVARYGGEEIAVVLPSTSAAGAHNLAEKIRLSITAMALPQEQSAIAKVVTMSIGCGTVSPTQSSSMEDFFQAVDAALYRAKQQGRNQTVSKQLVPQTSSGVEQ